MINQAKIGKYIWLGFFGGALIPGYFFLYNLPQKWIVLSAFTFAFIVANLLLYVIIKRVKNHPSKAPNELIPYLEAMGMGMLVMGVALYTLIGVLFTFVTQLDSSGGHTKYYFWMTLCLYVGFSGWKLYRLRESARYLLIPASIVVVCIASLIAGYLFQQGDNQAAFGFLILSNMNVMGLWFWVMILIYLLSQKSRQVIRDYNDLDSTIFDPTHPAVVQMQSTVIKALLIVGLCGVIKFGSQSHQAPQTGVITDSDLRKITEPAPSPGKIKELEQRMRRQRLSI